MSSLLEVVIVEQVFAVLFLLVGDDSSTIVVGKNVGVDLCLAIIVRVGGRVSGTSACGGVGWQPVGAEPRGARRRRRVVLRVILAKQINRRKTLDPESVAEAWLLERRERDGDRLLTMRAGPEGSQGADVWWWLGLRREGELWGEAGDNREVSAGSLGVAGKLAPMSNRSRAEGKPVLVEQWVGPLRPGFGLFVLGS